MNLKAEFTLVEMMVVVAISAILASVAIPAYVNYINRAKQTEAVDALMQAKIDQEYFYADHNFRYAGTIGCLASFSDAACLADCTTCARTSVLTANGYSISIVPGAGNQSFTIRAQKQIYGQWDRLRVSDTDGRPVVETTDALKWSLFQLLFN